MLAGKERKYKEKNKKSYFKRRIYLIVIFLLHFKINMQNFNDLKH